MSLYDKVIIALDCDLNKADFIINYFENYINCYKIGLSTYLEAGNDIIDYLHNRNKKVILDINICEVPSVAVKILNEIKRIKVDYVTVNLFGGYDMLRAISDNAGDVYVIGKSLNSSFNTTLLKQTISNKNEILDVSDKLVKLASMAGIERILCSPLDNKKIKKHGRIVYNNGIRYKEKGGDHKRWTSPKEAIDTGASYLIIGREVYDSESPFTVLQSIVSSIGGS